MTSKTPANPAQARARVTTNDPPPDGDLVIRSAAFESAPVVGAAEKDGIVTVLDTSAVTAGFTRIAWPGGTRLPAATGFAHTSKLQLLPDGAVPPPPSPSPSGVVTAATSHLRDAFFVGLIDLAEYFRSKGSTNITAVDMLKIFQAESSVLTPSSALRPTGSHVVNSSGCAGLNQICPTVKGKPLSGLLNVGFTGSMAEYIALAPEDQLRFVRAFFDTKRLYARIHSVADLYLVNFSPAFVGSPPSTVMYRESDPRPLINGAVGKNTYDLNAGIDFPKKGFIAVGDMGPFVERSAHGAAFAEAVGRIQRLQAVV